ncbi:enolase C-terminal domain-like protein [Neobacillus massiliamazoniensis]|uniref:Mandelate racemase/muconate lactonizing protein n=1 Tax=Neobacillus massiliamazoniensis TaxID=1499688 RepID=A0A0U1NR89_9BACI|nr:enolase C-terminal domain-like protein [Neobacillus massiliamazoniensis]CRK80268.1 mandelate racemase/muconate lactonizing protein [Neobacillus massiliamazoniensis]
MKIIDVKAYGLHHPVENPFKWRKGLPGSGEIREQGILRIITDEGIEGVAVTQRAGMTVDYVTRCFKQLLIGKNPLLKEKIWHEIWEMDRLEEFQIMFMGLVDMALWDITAKKAGMPLYHLLGGNSDRVQAYASTVTYDTTEQFLTIADYCIDRGYKAIKLHAWGDARKDAKLCQNLRKHVGNDIKLMYDGSAGFNLHDAIYLGKALEEADYYWYEEPMRESSIWNYKKLCDELSIPVLAAETSDGCHYNAADFIVNGACDMIRTGTLLKGGITGSMRIAHLADSFNMKAEIHGGDQANVHLACGISNCSFFEVLVFGTDPVDFGYPVEPDGFITAPQEPGIGYIFDWNEIEKKAVYKV